MLIIALPTEVKTTSETIDFVSGRDQLSLLELRFIITRSGK